MKVEKIVVKSLGLLLAVVMFVGCNANKGNDYGTELCLDLSVDNSLEFALKSRNSSLLQIPQINDFTITVLSGLETSTDTVLSIKYNDLPLALVLKAGQYTVQAHHGPGLDIHTQMPTYRASETITVNTGLATTAKLTAKVHSPMLEINYDEYFLDNYKNYYVEIITSNFVYQVAQNKSQTVFIQPQTVSMLLYATDNLQTKIVQVIDQIQLEENTHYIYNLILKQNEIKTLKSNTKF